MARVLMNRGSSGGDRREGAMKVQQIMTRVVRVCRPEDALNTASQMMWESDCGCIPVVSANGDGRVIGMLTDRDICMAAYTQGRRLMDIPAATAMSREVLTCSADDDLKQAEELMREKQVRRLPVVDEGGRLQGIISLNDIAREFDRERKKAGRKQVQAAELAGTLAGVCRQRPTKPAAAIAA
jgi:CBS domain-containing protein